MYNENPWWKSSKEDLAVNVSATFNSLHDSLRKKILDDQSNLELYGGRIVNFDDFSLSTYTNTNQSEVIYKYNISQSIIDTLTSKIGKMKPRPLVVPNGGEWETKAKAKKINKTILGQFDALGMYKIARKCFRSACINGSSFVKVYSRDGKIQIDPVMSHEILVDEVEGMHGNPRQLFQTKLYPLEVLKEEYSDHAKALEMSKVYGQGSIENITEMIKVVEVWTLPSSDEAKDGRHVIFVPGVQVVLFDEEWDRDGFPFAKLDYLTRPLGFCGQGVCEIIYPLQSELNYFLKRISEIVKFIDVPFWAVPRSANINNTDLRSTVIGRIVEFDGLNPPVSQASTGIPGELFKHVEFIYEKAYEILGLSQLSASAKKQAGLDSGTALRTFQDIESERFQELGLQFQDFFLDIAKLIIQELAEMPETETRVENGDYFEQMKWSDIDLDEDMYELQMFPVSSLPDSPEGRMQYVQELVQAGYIDQQAAMQLLDLPDIQSHLSLEMAGRNLIERNVEKIMIEGEYGINERPDAMDDLDYAKSHAKKVYQKSRLDNSEIDRLALLSQYISDVVALLQAAQTAPTPPAPPPVTMGPPPAAMGPPPPSMGPAVSQGRPELPPVTPMLPFKAPG